MDSTQLLAAITSPRLPTGHRKSPHAAWLLGLLLAGGNPGQALALERLFIDEAERQTLDKPAAAPLAPNADQAQADKAPSSLRLDGYVAGYRPGQQRKGRKTVWINGSMHDSAQQARKALGLEDIKLLDEKGRPIRLRSGQTLDLRQRNIREVYQYPQEGKTPTMPIEPEAEQTPSP